MINHKICHGRLTLIGFGSSPNIYKRGFFLVSYSVLPSGMGMGHATFFGAEVVKYEIWDTAGQERYKSLVLGPQQGMV
jgi:GTPase SAR1 family protein